jgi:hypothetical protein
MVDERRQSPATGGCGPAGGPRAGEPRSEVAEVDGRPPRAGARRSEGRDRGSNGARERRRGGDECLKLCVRAERTGGANDGCRPGHGNRPRQRSGFKRGARAKAWRRRVPQALRPRGANGRSERRVLNGAWQSLEVAGGRGAGGGVTRRSPARRLGLGASEVGARHRMRARAGCNDAERCYAVTK